MFVNLYVYVSLYVSLYLSVFVFLFVNDMHPQKMRQCSRKKERRDSIVHLKADVFKT